MTDKLFSRLETYPRVRTELPDELRKIYEAEYRLNREGEQAVEGLAKRVEGWMHRHVAAISGDTTLELGAGTLNHLRYEQNLKSYDVVEPFTALYEQSDRKGLVRDFYDGIFDVPMENRYERIISIAALEHMEQLPFEMARACQLLTDGGVFQAGIPSEGGALWWLGWRCTTGMSFWLRNRMDYGLVVRHEHVNTGPEIIAFAKALFEDVELKYFPLPHHHLSLYVYIEARNPRLDVAEQVLQAMG